MKFYYMCLRPIHMKKDGKMQSFSCGSCLECVKKYQNQWRMRLIEEFKDWRYCYLLTLTYSNENLPYIELKFDSTEYNETDKYAVYKDFRGIGDYVYDENGQRSFVVDMDAQAQARFEYVHNAISKLHNKHVNRLRKRKNTEYFNYLIADNIQDGIKVPVVQLEDVQKWIKRARIRYERETGNKMEFKYFVCSEYGPNTFRPHYHLLLFSNDMEWFDINEYFVKDWKSNYGDVDWTNRPVKGNKVSIDGSDLVSSYVSKYCLKPAELENPYVVAGLIPRTFRKMSKGIGNTFKEKLVSQVRDLAKTFRVSLDSKFSFLSQSERRDFAECLFNKLRYFRDGFFYSMSRYWKDAVFPHKYKEGKKYNKNTKKYETVYRYEKDTEHFVSLLYKEYVESRYFEDLYKYEARARAENPNGEDVDIFSRAEDLYREDLAHRNREAWTKLYNSYYKQSFVSEF